MARATALARAVGRFSNPLAALPATMFRARRNVSAPLPNVWRLGCRQLYTPVCAEAYSPVHSSQRLPHIAAGNRNRETGALTNVGTNGYVWSSSSNYAGSNNAGNLNFNSSNVNPLNNTNRANGFSVRCVQHLRRAVFKPHTIGNTEPVIDDPE